MPYTEKDFSKLRFNPMIQAPLLQVYPDVGFIVDQEWRDDPLFDYTMRYVIMCYDPESPLIKGENDINYRKAIAAGLSGFNVNDPESLIPIHTNKHDYLPELITRYLRRFAKSKEWAAIAATEFKFWESIGKMLEPIAGKDSKAELEAVQKKSAISAEINVDIKRLKEYYKDFYSGDETLSEAGEEDQAQRFNSEEIANALKDKKR